MSKISNMELRLVPGQRILEKISSTMRRKPFLAIALFLTTVFVFLWFSTWSIRQWSVLPTAEPRTGRPSIDTWNYDLNANNLSFDHAQCLAFFPDLFQEVDRAVDSRKETPITLRELDTISPKNGYVRAMIFDQQLYVVAVEGQIYSRGRATLQAIHRALLSSPILLPNIEFAFNADDIIFEEVPLWAYARRSVDDHIWLIPDFGQWSWPETKVGTLNEVRIKAEEMESHGRYSWQNKISKLLWRGAIMNLPLREHLIEITRDKVWADVVALNWHDHDSMIRDLKSMAEHCQYKYLMHTEGNSYSGRLKYLQQCQSVVVAHKMDWIQHYYPLMHKSGPHQNYVEIDRDLHDLEDTIRSLETNPREAQRIALNNVRTFRERYLTPSAEVCYWRYLIRQWSKVSFQPDFYKITEGEKVWRGVPVESYLLEGRLDWDPY